MFLLGHVGFSLGFIYGLVWIAHKKKPTLSLENIDFRLVIVAALLPDIIDKFVGMVILKEEISNGRIFTHSILGVGTISLYIAGISSVRSGHILKSLLYAAPVWMHLLLDRMWEQPKTLLWPLFGPQFPRIDIEISDYFDILFSEPYILLSEIVGGLIIAALILQHRLYQKTNLVRFFEHGKIMKPGVK